MSSFRISFSLAILTLCAIGGIAAGVILSAHPGIHREPWTATFMIAPPYFLLAGAGLLPFTRVMWRISLMIITGLVMFIVTAACYADTRVAVSHLNAQAAGRHAMYCGPPSILLVMPIAYGMSASALAIGFALMYWDRQRGHSRMASN